MQALKILIKLTEITILGKYALYDLFSQSPGVISGDSSSKGVHCFHGYLLTPLPLMMFGNLTLSITCMCSKNGFVVVYW
jgi:hypothetical protein